MSQAHNPDRLIPSQPVPSGAEEFSSRVHGLLDGRPKEEATVSDAFAGLEPMFDLIAAGMYSLASMLVGEGEESVQLVERAVATTEVSQHDDAAQARKNSRIALSKVALQLLAQRDPAGLFAPADVGPVGSCIDDDDLDAAGVSGTELEKILGGPDRDCMRAWLASLSTQQRVVFVMRAVAGLTPQETAALLVENGGARAVGWTPEGVRGIFRRALCSLASQLLHETTTR